LRHAPLPALAVREIGLFVTSIDTPDRVLTYVGNNKLFSDNLQNFSANPLRRVDLTAQLPQGTDVSGALDRLKEMVQHVPNVLNEPEPSVEILTFSAAGPTLTVRPYCHNEHYWQVYFDTNRLIGQLFGAPEASPAT
jgi:small conductance mechanosensitive channel